MRRRDFIKVTTGSAAMWPLAAHAQQSERVRSVGVLFGTANDSEGLARAALIRQGLSELGWTEGRNIHVDVRWAAGDAARAKANAAELVSQNPDVIVVSGTGELIGCATAAKGQ